MTRKPAPAPWTHIVGTIRMASPDTRGEHYAELDVRVAPDRSSIQIDAMMFADRDHSSVMTSDDPAVVRAIAALFDTIFVLNEGYRESGRALETAAD